MGRERILLVLGPEVARKAIVVDEVRDATANAEVDG